MLHQIDKLLDNWVLFIIIAGVAYSAWAGYQGHARGYSDPLRSGHCFYVADLGFGAVGYREVPCPMTEGK